MPTSQKIHQFSRKIHAYIGVFIAPAVLFFSFTGALQTFNLHETTQGSSYTPPKWLVALGQLHKKQTPIVPVRRLRPASPTGDAPEHPGAASRPGASAQDPAQAQKNLEASAATGKQHLPMKIFFLLVALGLALSTLTGIYMALKYHRPLVVFSLLIAGVVVPCTLLAF
jgi:hypothetical protein